METLFRLLHDDNRLHHLLWETAQGKIEHPCIIPFISRSSLHHAYCVVYWCLDYERHHYIFWLRWNSTFVRGSNLHPTMPANVIFPTYVLYSTACNCSSPGLMPAMRTVWSCIHHPLLSTVWIISHCKNITSCPIPDHMAHRLQIKCSKAFHFRCLCVFSSTTSPPIQAKNTPPEPTL